MNLFDRPFYSIAEMSEQKDSIKPVYKEFSILVSNTLRNQKGCLDTKQLNSIIKKAKDKKILSQMENNVVESFFDTYLGAWNTGGRKMANDIANKILN